MERKNDVVAVVVTYNRKELLSENLYSLEQQSRNDFDIIVIDNNSNDGTDIVVNNFINKSSHDVYYEKLKKNLGGAGGFNIGIKSAINKGYRYAWIMDDDTIPTSTAYEEFQKVVQLLNGKFGFLSSYVKWIDNSYCVMNATAPYEWWVEDEPLLKYGLLRIKRASFVSMFLNMEVVSSIGLPIKEFFIWGDDTEYSARIANCFPCYYCDKSIVIHKMKKNMGVDIVTDDVGRIQNYYYDTRNGFYIARKNGIMSSIRYIIVRIALIKKIVTKSTTGKIKKSCIVLKGLIHGLFFNPTIEMVDDTDN